MTRATISLPALALALLTPVFPAHAGEADVRAAQGTITSQLQAFLGDRLAEAYSYAAPNIQSAFPSVADFMAMVNSGYQMIRRPRNFAMGQVMSDTGTRIAQKVIVTGPDGKAWEALYTLERQADGKYRITSVSLHESRFLGT